MKSPQAMSASIRTKKKAMLEDGDLVDLSGIPMDKTDEDVAEANEYTSERGLDTNKPKARDEAPSAHEELMADSADRAHETEAPRIMPRESMAEGGMTKPATRTYPKGDNEMDRITGSYDINADSQTAEHAPSESPETPNAEALARRRARISKMMSR